MTKYVVGVDYGTLSGRAVVVRVDDGTEVGTAVHEYRHGAVERTLPATGEALPPHWALQMTTDWVDVLRHAVPKALEGIDPTQVVGIATDFTACTFLPVLADGTPLGDVLPDRPHAYPKLWKHHAAQRQADRINRLAGERGRAGSAGTVASSPRNGSWRRRCRCWRKTPTSSRGPSVSSRPPTGSCGS
ncbi:hypothetical protein [Dactylosporangium cerinum]